MAWNPTAAWATTSSAAPFSLWGIVSPVSCFPDDDQLALGMEAFAEPERFTGEEPELEPWMEFYTF